MDPSAHSPGSPYESLLHVRDLVTTVRVAGRDVPAVNGLSFELAAGRALGLVGESGCGKSLTAMSLLQLLAAPAGRIAGGEIWFEGQNLVGADEPALRKLRGRRIAMVFQEPSSALNPVLTIGQQVGEPLRVHEGLSQQAAWDRAVTLLQEVGIPAPEERAHAFPHQFSGGMKQRAMIAMALACRPVLLVADEPTTALDVTVQAQILDLLTRLRRQRGMALLLITHDLGVVAEICDDVAVMYAGRIVETATAAALFAGPRHPYTVGLLAAMNTGQAASAVATGRTRLREIPGTVPALGQAPPGCAFAARCDRATEQCRHDLPPLAPPASPTGQPFVSSPGMSDGTAHLVRCWHPVDPPGT